MVMTGRLLYAHRASFVRCEEQQSTEKVLTSIPLKGPTALFSSPKLPQSKNK